MIKHEFTNSNYTCNITYTGCNPLFTTFVNIAEALDFNVTIDHAFTRNYKEVYIEGDAKFIV